MDRLLLMLSHRSILAILAGVALGVFIVAQSGLPWLWLLVFLGIPAQMLIEYNLHRYIFHLPPPRRQWQFDLLYRAHYGHHDFPSNRELIFAPEFVVFPVLGLNFVAVWAILTLGGAIIDRLMGTAINREAMKTQQRFEIIRTLGMRPDDTRLIATRKRFTRRYDLNPDEISRAAQT